MIKVLKRYAVALFLLLAVSMLMMAGTMGVKSFSDKMVKDANIKEDVESMEKGTDAKEDTRFKEESTVK